MRDCTWRWLAVLAMVSHPARAENAVSCAGAAMMGGAQIVCSHTDPLAPTQVCTFSWALLSLANTTSIVEGSFTLATGASNTIVYQGSGYGSALSNPIVLCQGRKGVG